MPTITNSHREMMGVLDTARNMHKRVTLFYGDPKTGESWHSETGYIQRSTGAARIPLLVPYRNSTGGGQIETDTVVRIEFANKKDGGVLWRGGRR
jgi:hypothetical protein